MKRTTVLAKVLGGKPAFTLCASRSVLGSIVRKCLKPVMGQQRKLSKGHSEVEAVHKWQPSVLLISRRMATLFRCGQGGQPCWWSIQTHRPNAAKVAGDGRRVPETALKYPVVHENT